MADNLTAPSTSHGIDIGYDSWRLVVEVELPSQSGAVVGTAVVGTTKVAVDEWVDITGHVQGLDIQRGTPEFVTRGNPGSLTMSLDNTAWIFAPWLVTLDSFNGSARRFTSGLPIRVGLVKSGDWWPMFTGVVTEWSSPTQSQAVVVALETITTAVGITANDDDPVLTAKTTLDAIVDSFMSIWSPWPWGYISSTDPVYAGATRVEIKGVVLDIARSTVLASGADTVRSDTRGRLEWLDSTNADNFYGVSTLELDGDHLLYDDEDRLDWLSDEENVINSITYLLTPIEFPTIEDAASIARHGRRHLDIGAASHDQVQTGPAEDLLARFSTVRDRLEGLQVDDRNMAKIVGVELDQTVEAEVTPKGSPATLTATGSILTIRHQITPVVGAVDWLTTYSLSVTNTEAA
jgi:hypothetical protein